MTRINLRISLAFGLIALLGLLAWLGSGSSEVAAPAGREEVLFWHFWGGADRDVVERVVGRFNKSQDHYWVRPVAMPGNNLDLKLFLAVTGGDPPDLINQDDPLVADWASRGALTPIDELATPAELAELRPWLFPAARRLGEYDGKLYALTNGLDVRALYYNLDLLEQHGLAPPKELADLDRIAETIAPPDDGQQPLERVGYLPDPRRLWAWGVVFGGRFYDDATARVTCDDPKVVAALDWMTSYSRKYGPERVAAFRVGDQSLPGKTFPLLAGRYAVLMDGQWRVRDIAAAQKAQAERGERVTRYGVCPLPPPPGGRTDAGWVNGNFFLVPRGAKQSAGAWAFMKFWVGFRPRSPSRSTAFQAVPHDHALEGRATGEAEAARICIAGGWIPVSREVVAEPEFQTYLREQPLFAEFVRLAASENQIPTPVIPGAPLYLRTLNETVETAMYRRSPRPAAELLRDVARRMEQQGH